jgi:hypothetical protein
MDMDMDMDLDETWSLTIIEPAWTADNFIFRKGFAEELVEVSESQWKYL